MKRMDTFAELAEMYSPNSSTYKNAVQRLDRHIVISHLGDPFGE